MLRSEDKSNLLTRYRQISSYCNHDNDCLLSIIFFLAYTNL